MKMGWLLVHDVDLSILMILVVGICACSVVLLSPLKKGKIE
jgi:hypothetical protein